MRRRLAALVACLLACPAAAQDSGVVSSPTPQAVSVTVYRDPGRGSFGDGTLNLDWLGGFALVTETRTVRLPAGRATIRFEGVAGGIVPASAIVTGLPGGTVEALSLMMEPDTNTDTPPTDSGAGWSDPDRDEAEDQS